MQLRHKIALYIPSTIDGNIPLDSQRLLSWQRKTKSLFANCFGGCTAVQGMGCWEHSQRGLVEEQVMIVYSFVSSQAMAEHYISVRQFALQMGRELNQEAISLETENGLELVYQPKAAIAA